MKKISASSFGSKPGAAAVAHTRKHSGLRVRTRATRNRISLLMFVLLSGFCARECGAWDYPTHRVINQLALDSLPGDFPAFALTPEARERIAFLGGEADRWRNTSDLNHLNAPEHYFDVEEVALYGLDVHALTPFRYEFTAQLALARAAHPDRVPAIDPDQDRAHVRQLVGFLPWAIMENFDKLKSGFSYLKAYEDGGGTSDEIANARQNIIYVMGVMSHYVADASQPLHMTVHYNGWTGPNPNGYTTAKTIHAWIDGGYFQQIGGLKLKDLASGLHPAHTVPSSETFQQICHYLLDQQKQVEPLYKLEKAGKLSGEGEHGLDGKEFLQRQVVVGGQMLGNLWYSAWKQAGPDNLLRSQLARRKFANDPAPGK